MEITKGRSLRVVDGCPKRGDVVRCPACGCGHPWAAHRKVTQAGAETCQCRAEIAVPEHGSEGATLRCSCETWLAPPTVDEAAVEVAS